MSLIVGIVLIVVAGFVVGRVLELWEDGKGRDQARESIRYYGWKRMAEVLRETEWWHPETEPYKLWLPVDEWDEGPLFEFRYIVTQTEAEGPEYAEFRIVGDDDGWMRWESEELPEQVAEHFFGSLVTTAA